MYNCKWLSCIILINNDYHLINLFIHFSFLLSSILLGRGLSCLSGLRHTEVKCSRCCGTQRSRILDRWVPHKLTTDESNRRIVRLSLLDFQVQKGGILDIDCGRSKKWVMYHNGMHLLTKRDFWTSSMIRTSS